MKKPNTKQDMPCPCGSGRSLTHCCGPFVHGERNADTAEQLMRSRYTAYALNQWDYILDTWHPSTRPAAEAPASSPLQWIRLKIHSTQAGQAQDAEGWVEFTAVARSGGRAQRLHERSRFVRENGRWYYVDGEMQEV